MSKTLFSEGSIQGTFNLCFILLSGFSPVRHSRQAKTKFTAIARKRRAKAQR